jgi:MFS transporter, CP family, cyanate transporter
VLGALHDLTSGWSWPLALLLAAVVPMAWAGWGAARDAVLPVAEDAVVPEPVSPG